MSESLRQSLSLIALVTVGMALMPVAAVVHAIDRHHHRPPRDLTRWGASQLINGGERR